MKKKAFRVLVFTNALGEITYKLQERGWLFGWNTEQDGYYDTSFDRVFNSIDEVNDCIKSKIRWNMQNNNVSTRVIETDGPISEEHA